MIMSFEWTPDRITALIALWEEGLTTSVIGDRLGITKNAVVGKVHRLGLPKRGSPIKPKPVVKKKTNTVTMAQLRPGMCVWPTGDPATDDFYFCGDKSEDGRPYCSEHCAKAYVKPSKEDRQRRAANMR